ncbi:FAD binding domain-containing protein [Ophiocordyceps sinensis CO18]|nr:FAD binding domain-containing protein [Ophiocordyceps sinensis CO18]
MLYRAPHASGTASSRFVIQDLALPYDTAGEFVDYTARNLGIWPIWLVSPKAHALAHLSPQHGRDDYYYVCGSHGRQLFPCRRLDLGARPGGQHWPLGWGPSNYDAFVAANRALGDKLAQLGGRKWLYAQTFYSEDQFWGVYAGFRGLYIPA